MPKITFEKEVTEAQYEVYQMVLKLQETTANEFIWKAIVRSVRAEFESIDSSPLLKKTGFVEDSQSELQSEEDQHS